jgi:DNA repair exonuclease SbcCD ATPase subunit
MTRFFRNVREGLEHSAEQVKEISTLMAAMYRTFSDEHGLRLPAPAPFSMLKYLKEVDRLEATYERRFNTLVAMLTNEKLTLMQKFFETLASQVKRCYGYANREADQWLRAIMAPMEMQIREHQMQLRRRLESIKRIHQATDTLGDRIEELAAIERGVRAQLDALEKLSAEFDGALAFRESPLARAA